MPKEHKVKSGECLSSIAHLYGFHNWRLIYGADENRKLREDRPNPNVLHPGDIVVIPEKNPKSRGVATGKIHKHVLKRAKWHFRLILRNHRGELLDGIPYELAIDGAKSMEGVTSQNGLIDCEVPPGAHRGELRVLGQVHPVALGGLDPVTRISGVQARLANLGFDPGTIDGRYGPRTASAVYAFQVSQRLEATGKADDKTRKQLLKVHDDDDRCKAPEEVMALPNHEDESPPEPHGVLLAPSAEDDQREIVVVGAQSTIADGDEQRPDDVTMNFIKAAQSLRPDASNRGEAIVYVQQSGYSAATREHLAQGIGWQTSVIFFESVGELAALLDEWPSHTVVRMTFIAHGYDDRIALHDDRLDGSFFGRIARIFDPDGAIVSHACRTGDAKLAQQIANEAHVPVYAWTGRTSYAHKNPDGSLTEIHASELPSVGDIRHPKALAKELLSEIWARHGDIFTPGTFVRFEPGADGPVGPQGDR